LNNQLIVIHIICLVQRMSCIPTKFIIDYGNRVTNIVLEERELQY